jgi:uncharacterized protein YbjT (DUF2867 family)
MVSNNHHQTNRSGKQLVLITGATGNVGREVIRYMGSDDSNYTTLAAIRSSNQSTFESNENQVNTRRFDLEDTRTYQAAFKGVDILFLLRPPHISDVKKVFVPMLDAAWDSGIRKIVFLSVQGVESSSIIPHHKIEQYITAKGFDHVFVRPSYFMQNLTTTLLKEIQEKQLITLPSANAVFNWVDAANVGEASAVLIKNFDAHKNKAFDITGNQNLSFPQVVDAMSRILGRRITFRSMNPVGFYWKKRREGISGGLSLVMTLLHFLPRVQGPPSISMHYERLTGKPPTHIDSFIEENKALFGSES